MAGEHGGYRKPANPAPVSGPGANSRRTDGKQPVMSGLGNGSYGDESAMQQIQGGAKMAQVPSGPQGPPAGTGDPFAGVVPLGAPSAQPGVPVTDGAPAGAGAGPEALGISNPNQADAAAVAKYLPVWIQVAQDPNTPPGFKAFVRTAIANLQ